MNYNHTSQELALEDKRNPCALCGFSPLRAIHLPVIHGARKGEPWGHAFVPMQAVRASAMKGAQ